MNLDNVKGKDSMDLYKLARDTRGEKERECVYGPFGLMSERTRNKLRIER